MHVVLRPQAERELLTAQAWYELQRAGLGAEFASSVDQTISLILHAPFSFSPIVRDVRRALVRKFPYGVFFRILNRQIVILGIVHAKRHPSRWQGRG